jgi:hypothetical protein
MDLNNLNSMYESFMQQQEWSFSSTLLFRIGVFFMLCKAVAYYQRCSFKVYFNPQSKLLNEFVHSSRIQDRVYEPYFLCLSPFL